MTQQEIFIQMCLKSWNIQVQSTSRILDSLDDQALIQPIAPGKNTVAYLIGHLIAVNDTMIGLFGIGDRLYHHLDDQYVKNADSKTTGLVEARALKDEWKRSNDELSRLFSTIAPAEWFTKHSAMTETDLEREPGRNKLSVLINRTNHLAYHLGQLVLVQAKAAGEH